MSSDARRSSRPPLPSDSDLLDEVREFLAEELEIDPATVSEASRFRDDLGADSVTLLALFDELSLRYQVDGDFKHIAAVARERGIATVGDLAALAADHLAGHLPPM